MRPGPIAGDAEAGAAATAGRGRGIVSSVQPNASADNAMTMKILFVVFISFFRMYGAGIGLPPARVASNDWEFALLLLFVF